MDTSTNLKRRNSRDTQAEKLFTYPSPPTEKVTTKSPIIATPITVAITIFTSAGNTSLSSIKTSLSKSIPIQTTLTPTKSACDSLLPNTPIFHLQGCSLNHILKSGYHIVNTSKPVTGLNQP